VSQGYTALHLVSTWYYAMLLIPLPRDYEYPYRPYRLGEELREHTRQAQVRVVVIVAMLVSRRGACHNR
jgi:hypothetical protein